MAYLGDSPIAQWQIRQVEEVAIELSSTNLIQIHGCNVSDIDHNLKTITQHSNSRMGLFSFQTKVFQLSAH